MNSLTPQKQLGVSQLFELQEKTLAWDFINKSDIIDVNNGEIPTRNNLPKYNGVYAVASSIGFLYIGLSRGKICDRWGGRLDLKKKILDFSKRHDTQIFFYSMEFSDKSPIGSVYATYSSANYHESHLIKIFSPLFNIKQPPLFFGYSEEVYYREFIIEQNGIAGFSSYLIEDLRKTTTLWLDKRDRNLVELSNAILNIN
jgi:hypothetical protein